MQFVELFSEAGKLSHCVENAAEIWKLNKVHSRKQFEGEPTRRIKMAALTTAPDTPKSAQQSPRHTATVSTVAVRAGAAEVSKALQDGEKFIKWDEVSPCPVCFRLPPFYSAQIILVYVFRLSSHQRAPNCSIPAFEAFVNGKVREFSSSFQHLF